MKNLKNVMSVITLALVMLVSVNLSAQNNKTGPIVLDSGNSTQLEVPSFMKSTLANKSIELNDLQVISVYNKKAKGKVTVTFDSNNKVVSIFMPKASGLDKNVLINTTTSKAQQDTGCSDKPSDMGVMLCMVEYIVFSIFG